MCLGCGAIMNVLWHLMSKSFEIDQNLMTLWERLMMPVSRGWPSSREGFWKFVQFGGKFYKELGDFRSCIPGFTSECCSADWLVDQLSVITDQYKCGGSSVHWNEDWSGVCFETGIKWHANSKQATELQQNTLKITQVTNFTEFHWYHGNIHISWKAANFTEHVVAVKWWIMLLLLLLYCQSYDRLLVTTWGHDPAIISTSNILLTLNDALSHSAILVQVSTVSTLVCTYSVSALLCTCWCLSFSC